MVERLVWDRFRHDWKQFAWMAVWTFLSMGRGLRILVAQPREALRGVFALWVMQMAVGLLGELVGLASPFLLLPWAMVLMFYVPLVPYYFAERFEQKLRPVLN